MINLDQITHVQADFLKSIPSNGSDFRHGAGYITYVCVNFSSIAMDKDGSITYWTTKRKSFIKEKYAKKLILKDRALRNFS